MVALNMKMNALLLVAVTIISCVSTGMAHVPCTTNAQCVVVSEKPQYAFCGVDNLCHCYLDRGFAGEAHNTSKCHCPATRQVTNWDDFEVITNEATGEITSKPVIQAYCLNAPLAIEEDKAISREANLVTRTKFIYDLLLSNNAQLMMYEVISRNYNIIPQYFAPNAKGRIDPMGIFSSWDQLVEYFYSTVSTPAARITTPIHFEALFASGDFSFVRAVMTIDRYAPPYYTQKILSYNLTQSTVFHFDQNNLVIGAESIIHNLGRVLNNSTLTKSQASAYQICYLILNVARCNADNDPLGYYASFPECMDYMLNQVSWGDWCDVSQNTAICAYFHGLLARARPDLHCPHTGKTGGGKCILHTWEQYYEAGSYL